MGMRSAEAKTLARGQGREVNAPALLSIWGLPPQVRGPVVPIVRIMGRLGGSLLTETPINPEQGMCPFLQLHGVVRILWSACAVASVVLKCSTRVLILSAC